MKIGNTGMDNSPNDLIVRMSDITMSFAGNKVLDKVSFGLREGEVHSLMGANGAGKSTLIKILNGIYIPVSGAIEINGCPAVIRTPKDAERLGLAFVHQELNVCNDMSVAENIYIGNWARNRLGYYDGRKTSEKAAELLAMMGIDLDPDVMVRRLRTAEKQIIEILKALTSDARVLVLDEPTSSLNEKEKENFFGIVARLKAKGVSMIFISHFLEDVIQLSDRVTVLKDGINNGLFESGAYTKDNLVTAMMGRKIEQGGKSVISVPPNAPVALELRELTSDKKYQDINLKVLSGDIVGVCGLLGAGKTEIARSIFGLDRFDSGKIILFGEEVPNPTPAGMIAKDVVLLTEERKLEGFVPLMSIRENATMSIMRRLRNRSGRLNLKAQCEFAQDRAERLDVKMSSVEQPVVSLSGGNQQKVVIAKCMASNPKLFLLDEPTRGVDVFAKSEIYKYLRQAAENGTTIIIFSSELEELLENCSKIVVLKKGRVTGMVNAAETSKNDLLAMIG
jgi:ABC-type sugar transport system ATPase subunit